ncbi:MAG: hypothetical protein R3F62_25020 [Planctomycetota bacterium]
MPRPAQLLPPLLLAVLAVFVHLRALHGTEFTLDDVPLIAHNTRLDVQDADDAWALVTSRYWGDSASGERLWRPVPLATYALERRLHGNDPDLSRATNVALHTGCAWLVFVLLASWLPRRAALLAAAVFLCHPVHAEVTAGVVGRAEILALGGVLLALWLHSKLRGARSGLTRLGCGLLAALCLALAFGSKEIALAGPALIAAAEFARCRRSRRRRLRAALGVVSGVALVLGARRGIGRLRGRGRGDLRARAQLRRGLRVAWPYLLYAATVAGYLVARQAVLVDLVATSSGRTLGQAGIAERFLISTLIYLDSWLSLLVPHGTSAHYPFGGVYLERLAEALDPVPGRLAHRPAWGSLASVLPLALHATLLAGGAWLLRWRAPAARATGLGIWGFYLALGPASNLLVPIGVLRADRLLYTPSAWATLALVAGPVAACTRTRHRRALRYGLCVVAALLVGGLTWRLQGNLLAWSNNYTLWYRSYERYPQQPRIQLALGLELLRRRGSDAAESLGYAELLFRQAVAGSPPGTSLAAKSRAALGGVLLRRGSVDQAIALYLEATQLDEHSVEASEGLARAFLSRAQSCADPQQRLGWLLRAERTARQATRFALKDYPLWLTYGTILSGLDGREADALLAYDRAVALRALPWEAWFNRARLRAHQGDLAGALADYRAVGEYGLAGGDLPVPGLLEEALNQVARLAEATGDAEAQAWARRSIPAVPALTPR